MVQEEARAGAAAPRGAAAPENLGGAQKLQKAARETRADRWGSGLGARCGQKSDWTTFPLP